MTEKIRAIITDFYNHVFDDVMIGFMFKARDKGRLIEREYQHVTGFLGLGPAYEGRSMGAVHQPLRIFGGHFNRRQLLLKQAMLRAELDPQVMAKWLNHHEALRDEVLLKDSTECQS